MLGRLSMTITECITEYETLIPEIFANPRHFHLQKNLLPRDKYDTPALEATLQAFLRRRSGRPDIVLEQPIKNMCRV